MKIEITFVGESLDTDEYEAGYITWVFGENRLVVFSGADEKEMLKVASYREDRVVRVRVVG